MKNFLLTLVFIGCTITSFSQNNFRDVVHLKNGSIIKGSIIELVPDKQIKIAMADGSIFVYEMAEIDRVSKNSDQKKPTQTADFSAPTSKGK